MAARRAVGTVRGQVAAGAAAHGEADAARRFAHASAADLSQRARIAASAAVRAVGADRSLAAAGCLPITIRPPRVAGSESARPGDARRRRVRGAARIAARSAVGRIRAECSLAAVGSGPIAVTEAGVAGVLADTRPAVTHAIRRVGAGRSTRPAARGVSRQATALSAAVRKTCPARGLARPGTAHLTRTARSSARTAVRTVGRQRPLAAIRRTTVAVRPTGITDAKRAHADEASRASVRRAARHAAASAIGCVRSQPGLTSRRGVAIAIAMTGAARQTASADSAEACRVRSARARDPAPTAG